MRLSLVVGTDVFPLAKIGPGEIALRNPIALAPCFAHVVMTIDGAEQQWRVELPDGADSTNCRVRTAPVNGV